MTRLVAGLVLTFGLPFLYSSPPSLALAQASGSESPRAAPAVPPSLVGRWVALPERVPLSDTNPWARNALAVRLAELQLLADGSGSLTVTRSVQSRAGVAYAGSRVIERVAFRLGQEGQSVGGRRRYTTTVVSASRRYPDPPIVETALDGVRLELYPQDVNPNTLEIALEVFTGDGSFTATLRRQRAST